jgi:glycosyltransferase involved in cell wall biosynthesis
VEISLEHPGLPGRGHRIPKQFAAGIVIMARPRLLFLCQTFPYPPDGGAQIRTYHVLRLLARAFDVTALCFERTRTCGDTAQGLAAGREVLGRFAEVEVFPIPQLHSRVRYAWDHVRSVASGHAYTRYLYDSPALRGRLSTLLETRRFDLIHVDSLDLADYLPQFIGIPVACVHHDVEPMLLRRRAALERSRWRRIYIGHQARLRERVERAWCPRVALNVAVSARDGALLKRLAPEAMVDVVPNGVDIDEFQPHDEPGDGLAFVGGTTPFPNLDALSYFCEEILPHIARRGRTLRATWIGRAAARQQQEYRERYGVALTGYVDDVRPFMRAAACHIVPIRVGGGTRLKILNAWAMGKPVVTTSVGCEGLEAIDGENLLIRDDPAEFAEAVLSVLDDEGLRRRLGTAGRATVEQRYSWDVIGANLIETYQALAGVQRTSGARAIAPSLDRRPVTAVATAAIAPR